MRLDEIFSFDNLYDTYKNCRKSKQHKGEVVRFEASEGKKLKDAVFCQKLK